MLSSRYLHLHEALGLGPMWLKQSAKVLPAQAATAAPSSPAPATAETAAPAAKPVATRASADARLSAMASVNTARSVSDGIEASAQRPSEKSLSTPADAEPSTQPAHTVAPVITADIQPARVMVVSICPALEDSAAGQLFSGDAGILLDNMLAAINLKPTDAHKTAWVKTAAVFTPTPSAEQIADALPQLQAELAAAQAQAVLFLGQIFEQPHHAGIIRELCGNLPHFIIPHPARLLRQPQLKRNAWTELKKLKQILSG
ncbi:uracil-DNA glycosylase [Neisseria sp. Dent CA1/247]|uniref:uracil-DNA glycosylase family protein n=1 Tax=Neisseria sp. Dent CA1/247 TaxID=2912675 RepID=UPI001FD4F4FE|nr:uracil-DNA glycosylase family protein [Neisseria sp. Dent CA1/247]UOO77417.1 uracil-DNA glycosylase [Neisseria sp. Dent CA1/247]